jgi:hypothetical protein
MFTAHAKRLDCQVETVLIWSTLASALGAWTLENIMKESRRRVSKDSAGWADDGRDNYWYSRKRIAIIQTYLDDILGKHSRAELVTQHVLSNTDNNNVPVSVLDMSQAVSRGPLTAEARVRAWVSPCGIYGRQSGTRTGLSPSSSGFSCEYHFTVSLHAHIHHVGDKQYAHWWPQFQKLRLTPSTWTTTITSLYSQCSIWTKHLWSNAVKSQDCMNQSCKDMLDRTSCTRWLQF